MTFDEIFQQYVAQGFTKPTAGVAGIETLMPTTATVAPIVPIQQPQQTGGGGNDRDTFTTDTTDTTTNAGITSFSEGIQSLVDLYSQLPTPMNLIMRGIQNIQNPYTNIMGTLNKKTQDAIERDLARDVQSMGIGFGGDTTGQRAGGGGFGGNTAGGFSESDPSATEGSF